MKKEKLCVDCEHYVYSDHGQKWESEKHHCKFPSEKKLNLVTGELVGPTYRNCYSERTLSGGCSISGINFKKELTVQKK